ncbi:MAG: family 43 glycosylhydrolase [Clostridia bacterium]|nr:family 43 glycosylhydrolase [Clostridia bacterium]
MKTKQYCNPLDLNYEYRIYNYGEKPWPICLEAADPMMVVFEGEYYLFSSMTRGYWVSSDMADWQFIRCDESQLPTIYGYAPALMVMDGAMYFHQGEHDKRLYRNKTPKNPNTWELVTDQCYIGHDPFMYYDEIDDRVWASFGCGEGETESIKVVELDRHTLEPIGEVHECIRFDPWTRGWERWLDEHVEENYGFLEGSQILRHNNKWYLIYSGFTLHKCYCNGVFVSDNPTGPYEYAQNNPVSHKNTGFVGGAGHGCFFEDLHGNFWNVTCASVYVTHGFERRLNLFPAGFDEDGLLYANTVLGDYPITLPDGKRDHREVYTPYMLLSKNCEVTVSSEDKAPPENPLHGDGLTYTQVPESRYVHVPGYAVDEDIRTMWAAATRSPGEWIQLDLGRPCDVKAIQLNIYTYNLLTADPAEKYHEYVIAYSEDNMNWTAAIDNRGEKLFAPHALHETSFRARYIRVTFYHVAGNGFAAVSGLRVFGTDGACKPAAVQNVRATRPAEDTRNCKLVWDKAEGADGYVVRYGIAPDKLYNQYQVYGEQVEIRTLTKGISYYFRVDSFNGGGVTMGTVTDKM